MSSFGRSLNVYEFLNEFSVTSGLKKYVDTKQLLTIPYLMKMTQHQGAIGVCYVSSLLLFIDELLLPGKVSFFVATGSQTGNHREFKLKTMSGCPCFVPRLAVYTPCLVSEHLI